MSEQNKSFMYAIRFDLDTKQFSVVDSFSWIGYPIYDQEIDDSRDFDSLSEESLFYSVEELLNASIDSTNKVLTREEVRVALDKVNQNT